MKNVTIDLAQTIDTHQGPLSAIELRAPNLIDFFELGEPVQVGVSQDGAAIPVENDAALKAYVERLVVQPKDPLLLGQVGLRDAMRIKETILGFFAQARQANRSPASQTPSSSISGS